MKGLILVSCAARKLVWRSIRVESGGPPALAPSASDSWDLSIESPAHGCGTHLNLEFNYSGPDRAVQYLFSFRCNLCVKWIPSLVPIPLVDARDA